MVKPLHLKSVWLKLLRVKGQTSYQSHERRTEYVVGLFKISPGEKHRYNKGWYIELATGEPSESDIIRFEDKYGR